MAKKPVKKEKKEKKTVSSIDAEALNQALKIMEKGGLVEFLYEQKDIKIQLKKAGAYNALPAAMPAPGMHQAVSAPADPAPASAAEAASSNEDNPNLTVVKSPMVGTFYRAPSPESPPFVNVGDTVESGKTLCIIEAMKIMNEIKAETSGRVKEVLVENAQAIEFNQPILTIEKA
ncbi:MAG: acetyl-CoA carboxylase biotin carboxyl carrier protein [Candidatus Goldiibacteriota bacterium]